MTGSVDALMLAPSQSGQFSFILVCFDDRVRLSRHPGDVSTERFKSLPRVLRTTQVLISLIGHRIHQKYP